MSLSEVWYNYFGNNAPFGIDFGLEATGTELVCMTDWADSEVKNLATGEEIIKTRIAHTRTHMPPIVAATIAEYIPTERNSYLTKMGHEGFALEDYNRGYDFPFAESFINVFRIEVFQPDKKVKRCVLRYLWHFEWNYEPWLVSSVIYDGAKDKIDVSMDYLWENYFPESQETILKHKQLLDKQMAEAKSKKSSDASESLETAFDESEGS